MSSPFSLHTTRAHMTCNEIKLNRVINRLVRSMLQFRLAIASY